MAEQWSICLVLVGPWSDQGADLTGLLVISLTASQYNELNAVGSCPLCPGLCPPAAPRQKVDLVMCPQASEVGSGNSEVDVILARMAGPAGVEVDQVVPCVLASAPQDRKESARSPVK